MILLEENQIRYTPQHKRTASKLIGYKTLSITIFRKLYLIVVIVMLTNNNAFEIILKVNNDEFVVSNQENFLNVHICPHYYFCI